MPFFTSSDHFPEIPERRELKAAAQQLVLALRKQKLTLSTAESCTGGYIAEILTSIPSASQVYLGGVVSYTNGVKVLALHVPHETLETYGAVSEQTAAFMAEGAVALTGSDMAVSVTGLAGPDGDDRGNPVGTVFISIAHKGHYTRIYRLPKLDGSRDEIRRQVVDKALSLIHRYLEELL